MASASVLSPSPPGISSSSVSQPWHTCSTPTLVYPARICYPWYTSPGWVGMAVPYATMNIKFLMAVCRSQGVHKTRSLTFQANSWSQVGCLCQADPAPSSPIWVLQACSLLGLECDGILSLRRCLWPSAPSEAQARKTCIPQMHPSDP